MKNQPFHVRVGYAAYGFMAALRSESSFRLHVLAALIVLLLLIVTRPSPWWWVVMILTATIVMAAELLNTAIEHLADHLHPERHPQIRIVKDCAAAAVLVASVGALGVAAVFICDVLLTRAR
jgi:undecaprenol kinase